MSGSELLLAAVAAPFVGAVLALAFGRALGRAAAGFAIAPAALSFAAILGLYGRDEIAALSFDWLPELGIRFALRGDGFGIFFAGLVSLVGVLVSVYAAAYFSPRESDRLGRFYAAFAAFMGAMLGVALADDWILFLIFWEITSLTSYLLIGFHHERDAARAGALTAFLVTAIGGLSLMAGLVLVGLATGTFEIGTLAASAELRAELARSPYFLPALVLVLIGAFTKSAQFPFHFWLPGAMVAPTPVSAYLHAATMVKAGLFLLGRVFPLFAAASAWPILLVPIGLATFTLGAWQSFRQNDLKALLAYSTLATLGLVTLAYGVRAPEQDALQMLSHAGYKGGLFLLAGIIEHSTGTRDLRQLGGLRRQLPISFAICAAAVLSMAGIPPLFGFAAKEAFYATLLESAFFAASPALHVAVISLAVFGNALLLASGFRLFAGVFLGELRTHAHGEKLGLWLPPALLALAGVALGAYGLGKGSETLVRSFSSAPSAALHVTMLPDQLGPLSLSILTVVLALALYRARARVERAARALDRIPTAQALWDRGLAALTRGAELYSARWQNGSLRWYFAAVLVFASVLGLATLGSFAAAPASVSLQLHNLTWTALALAALMLYATWAVVSAETRLGAAIALTASGFLVALVYALYRSPDILLTQILIESVSTIFLLLVLYHLPSFRMRTLSPAGRAWDAFVSTLVGVVMFAFVLLATSPGLRETKNIAQEYLARSLSEAGGRNAVNVIIVDFRALDTLGEITVLVVVGLCVFGILRVRRREA